MHAAFATGPGNSSVSSEKVTLHRGLQGVYFDRTETTFIDGKKGILEYRGFSIHDLAEKSTFEETSYLLLYGTLPTRAELDDFDGQLKAARPIPGDVVDIIRNVRDSHPMDVLRTAVSALSATDPDIGDNSPEATFRKGIRLTSQVPTIVMAHNAIRNEKEIVEPDPGLSHAANFLYMLNGELPNDDTAGLLDRDFILHADHGSNASAFTARVVAATGADLHSAVTAGVAALSGPFHGGAAENVMTMAEEIGSPENAAAYVKDLLSTRRRVMGFGHRVYRAEDPRARHLRSGVRRLSHEMGEPKWYDILEAGIEAMKPYARRGIHVNVDFFAGAMYHLIGIPNDLFVPIFAVGRVPGWTIQVVEQYRHNILIRPLLLFAGEREREYVPIDNR